MWTKICILVLTSLFMPCLSLTMRTEPIKLYASVGSNYHPISLVNFLASVEPDLSLWKLLQCPTIDFQSYYDQSCELKWHVLHHKRAIWKKSRLWKFISPSCLTNIWKRNKLAAFQLLNNAAFTENQAIVDFKDLQCGRLKFGEPEYYLENLLSLAKFGPLNSDGGWCRRVEWRRVSPSKTPIWHLIDVACFEAVYLRSSTFPGLDLITDNADWSIRRPHPDYQEAFLRLIHLMILERDMSSRPWLSRWTRGMIEAIKNLKGELHTFNCGQSDSKWMAFFCHTVMGTFNRDLTLTDLIPTLQRELQPVALSNHWTLLCLAKFWNLLCDAGKMQKDLYTLIKKIFHNPKTNPDDISHFMAVISTRPKFASRHHKYSLHRLLLSINRWQVWQLLSGRIRHYPVRKKRQLIPLEIAHKLTIHQLRTINTRETMTLFANLEPGAVTGFHAEINYIQSTLTGQTGQDGIAFGFKLGNPTIFWKLSASPVLGRESACPALQSVLESFCFYPTESKGHLPYLQIWLNYLAIAFVWRCTLPIKLMPTVDTLNEHWPSLVAYGLKSCLTPREFLSLLRPSMNMSSD